MEGGDIMGDLLEHADWRKATPCGGNQADEDNESCVELAVIVSA